MFRQRYRTSMPLMSAQYDSDSDSIQLYLTTEPRRPTSTQGCSSLGPWVQDNINISRNLFTNRYLYTNAEKNKK